MLTGRSKQVGNFTAIKYKEINELDNLLDKLPNRFSVLDKKTNIKSIWISKSKCQRELGISRSTVIKALVRNGLSDNYKYIIENVD